ncbi:MAG TPA: HAD-IA family hydrolase [Gaiellaceae bacterium]|nr:HAD-IA family hydrolase [Gaiellaceae bacterium]
MYRAVVFDLWQTLVTPPEEVFREFRRRWSEMLSVSPQRLDELWLGADTYRRRETRPIRTVIAELVQELGVVQDLDELVAGRLELMRRALVPDRDVVRTLTELRQRRTSTALISNSTEDVALVWGETLFEGLFDAAVFSATAGYMKPDPEIYELALRMLQLDASACLFVGDGANDELEGARRVGMTPVLFDPDGSLPVRNGVQDWVGLRITAIPQVLDLVE